MDPRQSALWQRLESFRFDAPGTQLRFAARLARENGWSVAHAERVLTEYKRFCYLAIEAGHPVTPSEDVDQAWHLHLVYTRSYWGEFCPHVLGQPLHHGPTLGGAAEALKHDDWYRRTLDSYERHFGAKPPADLWPDAATRFGHDIQWHRVNRRDHWIVRKPRREDLMAPVAASVAVALVAGCDGNPLNWSGPDFLVLYGMLLAVIVCVNLVVRQLLRGGTMSDDTPLTAYEIAYLQGHKPRLLFTAITDLVRRKHLKLDGARLTTDVPLPPDADTVDANVVDYVATKGSRFATCSPKIDVSRLHEALGERGLVVPRGRANAIVLINVLPLVALLAFGMWKISIGMGLGKPVSFLVVLCIVNVAAILFTLHRPFRTQAGRRRLNDAQRQHASLRIASGAFTPDNTQVALAVALTGVAALELGAFDDLKAHMQRMPGSGYSSGSGSSSGGCSSDSGGGGDGGGGGCGGCGGGD